MFTNLLFTEYILRITNSPSLQYLRHVYQILCNLLISYIVLRTQILWIVGLPVIVYLVFQILNQIYLPKISSNIATENSDLLTQAKSNYKKFIKIYAAQCPEMAF